MTHPDDPINDWAEEPLPDVDPEEATRDQMDRWSWARNREIEELEAFLEVANQRRAELEERVAEVVAKRMGSIEWLTDRIVMAQRALMRRNPKGKKKLELTGGPAQFRDGGVQWEFTDEGEFREWARENAPDLLKPVEPPVAPIDKDAVKQRFAEAVVREGGSKGPQRPADEDGRVLAEGGEVVPGVRVARKDDSVTVYPKPPKV